MASSRTGLTPHLKFRKAVLTRDRKAGITHCPLCEVELDYAVSRMPYSAEPDHIIAIAHGGTNHPSNGRAICRRCNQQRGAGNNKPRTNKAITASPGW